MQPTPNLNGRTDTAVDRLTRLQALTASLSEAGTSEQVADAILTQGAAVLGAVAGVVYRLGEDGAEFTAARMVGYAPEVAAAWRRFPADARTPVADAVREGRPVVVTTLAELRERYPTAATFPTLQGEAAVAALPLIVRGRPLGGVGLRFPSGHTFDQADQAFLLTLAGLCAQALERATLFDQERAARARAERAEAEARDLSQTLRAVIEASPAAVVATDQEGRCTLWNPAAEAMFGWTAAEVLGRPPPNVPADREHEFRSNLARVLRGEAFSQMETLRQRKDGTRVDVSLSTAPIRDAGGAIRGLMGVALDVTAQKQAEAEVRESVGRLRTLSDNLPQGAIYQVHADAGGGRRFLFISASVERLFGVTQAEAMADASTVYSLIDPDDLPRVAAAEEVSLRGMTPYDCEFRARTHSGHVRWFHCRSAPRPLPTGETVWEGIIMDVTDRKEAERSRRETEALLRAFLDHSPGALFVKDAAGRYSLASRAFEEALGVPASDILGKTDEDLFPLELARVFRAEDRKVADEGRSHAFEESFEFGGRQSTFLSIKFPLPDGSVGCVTADITDRVQAEQQLKKSEERYRTLFESMDQGYCVIELLYDDAGRPEDYRFLEVNPAFELHTGLHGAAGRTVRELVPDHDAHWFEAYGRVAASGEPTRFVEHAAAMGRWFDVYAFRFGGPAAQKVAVLFTDISRRIETEQERDRLVAELREQDRRKDEFLATLAHELRNPLAPLRNGLQVMRLADGDRDAAERAREMMERQLGQMVRLIDDLLELSRITRGKLQLRRERVELASVVRSAVESTHPQVEASAHRLTVSLPPEPVVLDADPARLAQVFANLLTNAAKYTDRGGRIWLTAERQGSEVVVSVKDTGIGIPPDHLPRLFEMFSQVDAALDRSQGGLGIGLSLVRGLVEMHGGSVEARSEGTDKGAEFIVSLPVAAEAPPSAPANPRDEAGEAMRARRRVLVADDNRDAADSLAIMLRLLGHDVHAVHDGRAAVEAAEWFRPDVVLLDIGMPELNGYEAARRIRERPGGAGMLLAALTGWGQAEDKRRAAEAGFDAHLTKPVAAADLHRLLAPA